MKFSPGLLTIDFERPILNISVIDISANETPSEEATIYSSNQSADTIPLREPTYYILLSLATQPRHGYAILKDISFLSEKRLSLSTSTLYTALKRLLEQGWIEREAASGSRSPGRERKVYRLTEMGRAVLEAEVTRLEALVVAAHKQAVRGSSTG